MIRHMLWRLRTGLTVVELEKKPAQNHLSSKSMNGQTVLQRFTSTE